MRLFFTQSVFAGLLIGIAGLVFLQVGGLDEGRGFGELAGAVLFAFGLMSVSVSKALLFTGKAGYLPYKESLQLIPMVLFNAIGCLLMASIAYYTINENAMETLNGVMVAREAASWRIALTSIGTGVIVTMALQGVRKGTYFPLLYGVPVFIMCGLPHSIADAFYYCVAILNGQFATWMIMAWVWSVIGNYIGCNLPRWFMGKEFNA